MTPRIGRRTLDLFMNYRPICFPWSQALVMMPFAGKPSPTLVRHTECGQDHRPLDLTFCVQHLWDFDEVRLGFTPPRQPRGNVI